MGDKALTFVQSSSDYDTFSVPIIGTAPIIIAHGLQWDIGGFWATQPLDVQERQNKIAVLTAEQKEALAHFGVHTNGVLAAEHEALLRGHWLPDWRPGFPASGFAGAISRAVVQHKGKGRDSISATKVKGALAILGDESYPSLVAIEGTYRTRTDTAKSSGMGAAPRLATRLEFASGWRATLRVRLVATLMTQQQVAQVIAWSGDYGIGQWRPGSPKGGTFGTYRIAVED